MNEDTHGTNTADENINDSDNINKSEINSINDKNVKKSKGGIRRRIVSYIITGIICSTLGSVGSLLLQ